MQTETNHRPNNQIADWIPEQKRWANWLEQLFLAIERPVNRISQSTQLNPFYHTGTMSLFLLAIVAASGFFLFIFFQYGYEASYLAVEKLESQPIGRLTRAVHRYASGALLVTTLLHALRMLFMERFRGPRWLAWTSGHVMVAFIWIAGVTGYWLLQDVRAQVISQYVVDLLTIWTPWGDRFGVWIVSIEANRSWFFLFLILAAHVLATLVIFGFFYLHIKRLSRAKLFPAVPWLLGMAAVMLIGSVIFPVGLLPQNDPLALPGRFTFDPIFLFFLPNGFGGWMWLGLFVFGLGIALLPWLSKANKELPKVQVLEDACTGCTRCATDCPYGAIEMVELPDGSDHHYLAVADPSLCVSCGICVGSCLDDAITLGETDPTALRTLVEERIALAQERTPAGVEADIELAFTCARFANQSAKPYLERQVERQQSTHNTLEVIPVPCAGAVSPDLLIYTLDQGAAEVRLIGCPPDDCANREGNLIEEQRLTRERPPKLKRAYANVPISAVWVPPNEFDSALAEDVAAEETNWLESRRLLDELTWKNAIPAFFLLAMVMFLQISSNLSTVQANLPDAIEVEIGMSDVVKPYGQPLDDYLLVFTVDGEPQYQTTITAETLSDGVANPFYERVPIEPGKQVLHLYLQRSGDEQKFTLAKTIVTAEPGQSIRLLKHWPGKEP